MAFKKSLFSKPAWAAKAATPVLDDKPIFQQNIYEDILEANRKKEERRQARQKQKEEERRRKSDSRDTRLDGDNKPVKKQRISVEPIHLEDNEEDDDFDRRRYDSASDSGRSLKSTRSRRRSTSTPDQQEKPVLRSNPKKSQHPNSSTDVLSPRKPPKTAPALDEDDDDFAIIDVQPGPNQAVLEAKPELPPPPESESDPDEDDYLKELKRQARAEAKAKKAIVEQRADTPPTEGRSPSVNPPPGPAALASASASRTPTPGSHGPADPEVHILIKTIIPNCEALIVKRRASQPLSQVLTYYTEKYQLGYLGPKLFFTWNGTKLFKSTTVKSILAMIKAKHGTKRDGSDLADGRIEIEAVTEEIHQNRLAFKEKERKRMENGGQDPDAGTSEAAATNPIEDGAPARPAGTIIHLKSNDDATLPNMNLRVHPSTTIEKIVRGYKRKMGVDMHREVYLVFDGEKLSEDQTVEDVGFEEGDAVDVGAKD